MDARDAAEAAQSKVESGALPLATPSSQPVAQALPTAAEEREILRWAGEVLHRAEYPRDREEDGDPQLPLRMPSETLEVFAPDEDEFEVAEAATEARVVRDYDPVCEVIDLEDGTLASGGSVRWL